LNGQIVTAAGQEKYVRLTFNVAQSQATGPATVEGQATRNDSSHYNLRATLVDKNTISVAGDATVAGKKGDFAFKIVRAADGSCQVSEVRNTLPPEARVAHNRVASKLFSK